MIKSMNRNKQVSLQKFARGSGNSGHDHGVRDERKDTVPDRDSRQIGGERAGEVGERARIN